MCIIYLCIKKWSVCDVYFGYLSTVMILHVVYQTMLFVYFQFVTQTTVYTCTCTYCMLLIMYI